VWVKRMEREGIPDLSKYSASQILTVLLIVAALYAALVSMGMSIGEPFNGYTGLALTLGLAAIAMAILTTKN